MKSKDNVVHVDFAAKDDMRLIYCCGDCNNHTYFIEKISDGTLRLGCSSCGKIPQSLFVEIEQK